MIPFHPTPEAHHQFQTNWPFRHLVVDNFLPQEWAEDLFRFFPEPDQRWIEYNNPLEIKRANDRIETMPKLIAEFLLWLNSGPFVAQLEYISGIKNLIPDCKFRGGGLHSIPAGGKLLTHSDRGIHPNGLFRRLNFLLYLNMVPHGAFPWNHGGELELFDRNLEHRRIYAPIFNRAVIFETTKYSYHGHANPWSWDLPRISIATYYFSTEPPEEVNDQSTHFVLRPEDEKTPEIAELIAKRNQGRLSEKERYAE